MVGIRFDLTVWLRAALAILAFAATGSPVWAQGLFGPRLAASPPPPERPDPISASPAPTPGLTGTDAKEQVADVRVEGVDEKDLHHVVKYIRTHAGRPFSVQTVHEDVRRLMNSGRYVAATPSYQRSPSNGLIIVFRVVERPTIKYVKYVGNTIRERHLKKKTNLSEGDPFDENKVQEGRRALLEYYQEKGFNKASVFIIEGTNSKKDRGVVYLINEGVKQKILNVEFEGNTIASDGRLKTQIGSKPPILYLIKGELDRAKIDEDVRKLTDYYRALGFPKARVGRELVYSESQKWVTLRFIIDEGPRYSIRSIAFLGEKRFKPEDFQAKLDLKEKQYFDKGKLDHDLTVIQDMYGGDGYVFAYIQPDVRYDFDKPEIDLVYKIEEGERYAVGAINVKILGDYPHTRRNTILNRVSLHPGDVLDIRELRASERRLKASNLFANQNPAEEPRITFERPEAALERLVDNPDAPYKPRGQSPDNVGPVRARPSQPPARRPVRPARPYPTFRGGQGGP